MQLPAVPGGDRAAVSPPFPGPPVDPDDPACLRIAKAPRDQPRELLPFLRLRQCARSPPPHRNPRTCQVLRRPPETALRQPDPSLPARQQVTERGRAARPTARVAA